MCELIQIIQKVVYISARHEFWLEELLAPL